MCYPSDSVETLPILHQFTISVSIHDINRPSHLVSTPADNGSALTHSLTHSAMQLTSTHHSFPLTILINQKMTYYWPLS